MTWWSGPDEFQRSAVADCPSDTPRAYELLHWFKESQVFGHVPRKLSWPSSDAVGAYSPLTGIYARVRTQIPSTARVARPTTRGNQSQVE
eukprot:8214737-Pyramimonas_sp.AAC.1